MNKYKFVSAALAIALLAALVRLAILSGEERETASPREAVMQNILTRASVRSFVADKKIERPALDSLVRAGMAAPTAMDKRPWKFIVADDRKAIEAMAGAARQSDMFRSASAIIVVCGDTTSYAGSPMKGDWWVEDCSAASQNILLAAHAMGLGAVWTGAYPDKERSEKLRTALELPEHLIPLNAILLGYPQTVPAPKDKYNKENVRYNGW